MAILMLRVIAIFLAKCSENSLFISADTKEKDNMSKDYWIAQHRAEMCLLRNRRLGTLLLNTVELLPHKMAPMCFTYQHEDCRYTPFKYRFVELLLSRVVKCIIMCKDHSNLYKETQERKECPASRERDSWGKFMKNNYWAPSNRQTQCKPVHRFCSKDWRTWKVKVRTGII